MTRRHTTVRVRLDALERAGILAGRLPAASRAGILAEAIVEGLNALEQRYPPSDPSTGPK
jgi:hypothetical protein